MRHRVNARTTWQSTAFSPRSAESTVGATSRRNFSVASSFLYPIPTVQAAPEQIVLILVKASSEETPRNPGCDPRAVEASALRVHRDRRKRQFPVGVQRRDFNIAASRHCSSTLGLSIAELVQRAPTAKDGTRQCRQWQCSAVERIRLLAEAAQVRCLMPCH